MTTSGEIDAFSYLKAREREIIDDIWRIAQSGKPEERVRLEALKSLLNKIRADRHHTTLDGDISQSPMERLEKIIRENLGKDRRDE